MRNKKTVKVTMEIRVPVTFDLTVTTFDEDNQPCDEDIVDFRECNIASVSDIQELYEYITEDDLTYLHELVEKLSKSKEKSDENSR